MQYWEDFKTKFGFEDGEKIPPHAEPLRHVYCIAMNKLLIKYGSSVRVLPFERGGCHNPLLIINVSVAFYDEVMKTATVKNPFPDYSFDGKTEEAVDDKYGHALEEAMGMDIDQYVSYPKTKVSVKKSFQKMLATIG
jgi:hypothetical protein